MFEYLKKVYETYFMIFLQIEFGTILEELDDRLITVVYLKTVFHFFFALLSFCLQLRVWKKSSSIIYRVFRIELHEIKVLEDHLKFNSKLWKIYLYVHWQWTFDLWPLIWKKGNLKMASTASNKKSAKNQ